MYTKKSSEFATKVTKSEDFWSFFSAYLFRSYRLNRNKRTIVLTLTKYHVAIGQCKEGMVFTHTYIVAGMVLCTTLTHDNVSCFSELTAKDFHSKSLTF